MGNLRRQRDIRLATTDRRRSSLASKPNYQTTKFFTEYLLAIEIKKMRMLMNNHNYLGI